MKWILAILVAAAGALAIQGRDLLPLAALPFVFGCLAVAWLCERRLPSGRSEGASAATFGVAANVVASGFDIRLLVLPYGSTFDSLDGWWALWVSFLCLAGVGGIALGLRGLIRATKLWKLPAVVGLVLSLIPGVVSHRFFLWVVDAKGLQDLW